MKTHLVFGGTFNPIHNGHLALAQTIQDAFCFERFSFLPCRIPVHKDEAACAEDRVQMIKLALKTHPIKNVELCLDEIKRQSPSYMVETLTRLRSKQPNSAILLLMGEDSFASLPSWHQHEKILKLCHLLVVSRSQPSSSPSPLIPSGYTAHLTENIKSLQTKAFGSIYQFKGFNSPISSTLIRSRIKQNESLEGMLPAAVLAYIKKHHLYGAR